MGNICLSHPVYILPAHGCVLQATVSWEGPGHSAPPLAGAGLSHIRNLCCRPESQDLLQEPWNHSPQFPSTATNGEYNTKRFVYSFIQQWPMPEPYPSFYQNISFANPSLPPNLIMLYMNRPIQEKKQEHRRMQRCSAVTDLSNLLNYTTATFGNCHLQKLPLTASRFQYIKYSSGFSDNH